MRHSASPSDDEPLHGYRLILAWTVITVVGWAALAAVVLALFWAVSLLSVAL